MNVNSKKSLKIVNQIFKYREFKVMLINRKYFFLCLISLLIVSCSSQLNQTTNQYSDLDQEYNQFKTQALTQSYLKKKMDKWLSSPTYSKNLVREIEYAKFKHKDLLKDIVAFQPTMFDNITANTGVNQKRVESPFENYIQYINPYPSSPVANDATNITATSFKANWASVSNATSYKLFVDGSEVYSGVNTNFSLTSLTANSIHTYYVKAVNSAGTSQNSNTISLTLNSDIPLAPIANDATNITTTSFKANWSSVSNATSYKLKIDSGVFTDIGNVTNYSVTGLTPNTTHTYIVQAVNSAGESSNSNTISVTLNSDIPLAPIANDATNITTTSFKANWSSVSNATSYKLKIDNGAFTDIGNVSNYSVTGLTPNTTHTYIVQAINSSGTSLNSNSISLTLNAPISCLSWKNMGATTNGVYSINPDNNTSTANINVYCDMTNDGGGWTLVVAQYEDDVVTNWNEGIQSDYDPTLASEKGFALNSSQLPSDRTKTGFSKDLLPADVDYVNFVYNTGNLGVTTATGIKTGASYQIHRSTNSSFNGNDPQKPIASNSYHWNTLTFDRVSADYIFTWSFEITDLGYKGYAYKGALYSTHETFAWTVWVR